MKKLGLFLMAVLVLAAASPRPAEANPLFFFIATAITGGWVAVTYEECLADSVDAKECAKKTWREREPLDYSKLNE